MHSQVQRSDEKELAGIGIDAMERTRTGIDGMAFAGTETCICVQGKINNISKICNLQNKTYGMHILGGTPFKCRYLGTRKPVYDMEVHLSSAGIGHWEASV